MARVHAERFLKEISKVCEKHGARLSTYDGDLYLYISQTDYVIYGCIDKETDLKNLEVID